MSEKPETRYIFINSVLEFVEQTKVDGVDLDWEFPGYDWVDSGGALSLKPNRPEDKGFFLNCSLNYGLHLSENQKQIKIRNNICWQLPLHPCPRSQVQLIYGLLQNK